MRVVLIHQVFNAPEDAGGTRHFELARHVVQKGHSFVIVASNLNYLTGQRTTKSAGLIAEQYYDGVRILRTYTFPSLHRSYIWRIVSFLSFMLTSVWSAVRAGPVDLVMGTSPPIFQAISACLVAALRRRPFLLEIRDLWPEFAIDIGLLKNRLLVVLSRRLEHWLYTRATHIVVNSPAYQEYLIGRNVPAAKISLIANGVEPEMFDPCSTGHRFRQQWNLDGQFLVTYAGALGLANDLPTVIRAASRLKSHPEIKFALVGDGKERQGLEKLAREFGLSNVIFAGSHPKTEIPEILAASDACLATLKDIRMFRTTYPNKVFDYMAAGRPTVLAIDGVIRDVIEAADGGVFVPPGDDEALATTILNLFHNRDRTREMGVHARSYVAEHFNRHQQAEEFCSLLLRLAGNKRT